MAHEVGAGKTAAMFAAGMYMKNMGVIKKPIYVVPNHLSEQWANEFLRFFPSANILVTTKHDFEKKNRNKFVSKIAMGEYDAIIIGHSQFERIPVSKERQERLLNVEISSLTRIIEEMKAEKGENWAIKQIVIFQNNLKDRLERLTKEERKDNLLDFEQLGVDYMFVDEAHLYNELCYKGSFGNDALLHSATALSAVHSEDLRKGDNNSEILFMPMNGTYFCSSAYHN
jgi:N12 class adenine-specific DNA methylase